MGRWNISPDIRQGSVDRVMFGADFLRSAPSGSLCLPELKDRTLEETDELFTVGLPAWKFKGYQTSSPRSDAAMFPGYGDLSEMPKDTVLELETVKKV